MMNTVIRLEDIAVITQGNLFGYGADDGARVPSECIEGRIATVTRLPVSGLIVIESAGIMRDWMDAEQTWDVAEIHICAANATITVDGQKIEARALLKQEAVCSG